MRDALGYLTETSYNALGLATNVKLYFTPLPASPAPAIGSPPSGSGTYAETQYAYDKLGRLVSQIEDAGGLAITTSYDYTARGQVWKLSEPDGKVTYTWYDKLGRVTDVRDALGYLTETSYNALGLAISVKRYDTALTTTPAIGTPPTGSGTYAETQYTYDKLGRVLSQIEDAGGLAVLTSYAYTARGQVWMVSEPDGKVTYTWYDKLGRVTDVRDALGYLSETSYTYTAQGLQTSIKRYDTPLPATPAPAIGSPPTGSGTNVESRSQYDKLGRLVSQIEDAGGLAITTSYAYTARGQVWMVSEPDGKVTYTWYDKLGRVSDVRDALGYLSETSYTYSALGLQTSIKRYDTALPATPAPAIGSPPSGSGTSVESRSQYDKLGRLVSQIEDAGGLATTTSYEYTARGQVWKMSEPDGKVTYTWYDKLGRVTDVRDALGYLTETSYTYAALGLQTSVKQYDTALTTTAAIGSPPTGSGPYAETKYQYDKLGRVTLQTDARSNTEYYLYDGRGNRTQVTNRLLGVTTYIYDALDRLTREYTRDPDASSNISGTYAAKAYGYDGRGNRTSLVEGTSTAITASAAVTALRTTNYSFDKLDRVIKVTHDQVSALADDMITAATVTPTEDYSYDARGNVIKEERYGLAAGSVHRDAAVTFTYFDKLNRKITEIRATTATTGIRSDYGYDQRSNLNSTKVYSALVNLPTTAGGAPAQGTGNFRQTTFAYDNLDRLTDSAVVSTTDGALVTGSWNGTTYATTTGASLLTHYDYDARGNVLKSTDPNGNITWIWYDKLDQKTAQLDAEGYLTKWDYDDNGNVVTETRYATQWTGAVTPASPPSVAVNAANDRITGFTYDQTGNKLTEMRTGVASWLVNPANGQLTQDTLSYSFTQYTYNALGQVLTKEYGATVGTATTPATATTSYTYDNIGRLQTEARAQYVDVNGSTVTPTTAYKYDAIGNLISTVQAGTSTGTYQASTRTTSYTYGEGGRLQSMTDAELNVHSYSYDSLGRQKKDAYARIINTDATSTSSTTTTVAEATGTTYDAAGRTLSQSIWSTVGGTLTRIALTSNQYNSFDQVTSQGQGANTTTGAALYQATNTFDSAGRLIATNAGDGVWKFFGYDENGNQTVAVTSAGYELTATTGFAAALALATDVTNGSKVNATYTVYDKRNQATKAVEEGRDLSATVTNQTLTTLRTYNAFGETATETNALNAKVAYTYNSLGKLIRSESPAVQITNENGSTNWVKPSEDYYYDRAGRRIAVRDANGTYAGTGTNAATAVSKTANTGNLTSYVYLAGTGYSGGQGLVTDEFHADGGHKQTFYDRMGDARVLRDELYAYTGLTAANDTLHFAEQRFNRLGQMIEVKHNRATDVDIAAPNDNTRLIDSYAYDQFGQRIQHSNSQLTSSVSEKASYDALSRTVSKTDLSGNQITTGYSWDSALAVTGVQGSWTETTTYWQNATKTTSKQAISQSDIYDREYYKVDLGGHTFSSTYDKAARLITKGSVSYTWYNTGHLASSAQNSDYGTFGYYYNFVYYKDRDTSSYSYDALGRRLTEQFKNELLDPTTGAVYQTSQYVNETATYDALGRLTTVTESGSTYAPAATITNSYDATGNIRRTVSNHAVLDKDGAVASTTTDDLWFRYDSMNRVVVNRGVLNGTAGAVGTTIVRGWGSSFRTELSGQDIGYDAAGQRSYMLRTNQSMALYVPQYNEERENYSYDGAGHLTSVYVTSGPGDIAVWNADYTLTMPTLIAAPSTGGQKTSTFGYDLMGRQTTQSDFDSTGTNAVYSRTAIYDLNGQLSSDSVSTTKNDGNIYKTDTTYSYADVAGLYQLGSVYSVSASNYKNATYQNASSTVNAYQWWDGAVQGTITNKPDTGSSTAFTTSFIYDSFGQLYRVSINDGRPRTVNYRTNGDGQIIRRDESDNNSANGDPHEVWYRFNGMEVGYIGNNGTSQLTATGAVADRRVVAGDGAYRNGSTSQTTFNDFAQSVAPLNSFSQGTASGSYVVQRDGETLSSIARNTWGDASLWYEIAEANGLTGNVSLNEGQRLTLPSGVVANKHNAGTFQPYDPNEAIGNVSPTTPKPPKKNNCGVFGQILLAVIAIAITVIAPFGGGFVAQIGNAMLGSVVSQGVGVATGIQEKFSFGAVALAGIAAVVGGGIGKIFGNGAVAGSQFVGDVVRGVAGSAVTQGIGVATGLQDKFSWAGVAAAGIGAGIGGAVMRGLTKDNGHFAKNGPESQTVDGKTITYGKNAWVPDVGISPSFGVQALAGTAQLFAGAATRSALEGTSFGDAIVQGLPDAIGGVVGRALGGEAKSAIAKAEAKNRQIANTIGNLVADQVASGDRKSVSGATTTVIDPQSGQKIVVDAALADQIRLRHDGQQIDREIAAGIRNPDGSLRDSGSGGSRTADSTSGRTNGDYLNPDRMETFSRSINEYWRQGFEAIDAAHLVSVGHEYTDAPGLRQAYADRDTYLAKLDAYSEQMVVENILKPAAVPAAAGLALGVGVLLAPAAFSVGQSFVYANAFRLGTASMFTAEVTTGVQVGTPLVAVGGLLAKGLAAKGASALDEMGSFTANGSEVFHSPGLTRVGGDEFSVRVGQNVDQIDGMHNVVVHGTPYDEAGAVFNVDGQATHANQIADAILANPSYNGEPIRLLTCYGGCGPAQELSDILQVPVRGATGPVGVPRVPNSAPVVRGGSFLDFFPRGGN